MRIVGLIFLAVAGCIFAPASTRPVHAQDANYFNFSVCNLSGVPNLFMAITSFADAAHATLRVIGWYKLSDAGCSDMGSYRRDAVFIYIQGPDGMEIAGDATTQCVNLTEKFERIVGGNYECLPKEEAKGFFAMQVPANMNIFVMTINPPQQQ